MDQPCKIIIDGGILDIGTRFAIYGTALLTIGLGGLAMISVSRAIVKNMHRRSLSEAGKDDEMYAAIREQKNKIRPVGTTLNIMGIAIVIAAFFYQYRFNAGGAGEVNPGAASSGPFTLFHGYMLLSLLWLITFTGLMIHINTWVFNVIRRQSFRHIGQSKKRFINCIWNGTHWYLLQVEVMGIYGYYLCTHRDEFPPPPCSVAPFNNVRFQEFAKIIYIFAMIPVLNVALLCVALVGPAWLISLCATYLNNRRKRGSPTVSPTIFHFFWFMFCAGIVFGTAVTIEVLVFTNTHSQNMLAFGSLLALTLLLVPGETFVRELYVVLTHDSHESVESYRFSQPVAPYDGPHQSVESYQDPSHATSAQNLLYNQYQQTHSFQTTQQPTIRRPTAAATSVRTRYR